MQLAASKNKLEPKSYNFNGLDQISREQFGNLYKYYYGYTSNYALINKMKQEAIDKGFSSCYVVAFKGGKQINLTEALKTR